MFGLDNRTTAAVLSVLKNFPSVQEAKIFGSRALGNFRPNSDVDIALFGPCENGMRASIAADLDALSTPYQFDVVCYSQIQNNSLKDHIDRVGRVLYKNEKL